MNSPRILFTHAAIFNCSIGFGILFAYQFLFGLIGMAPIPSNPLFLHLFAGIVVIFGIGYYWVSRDLQNNIAVVKMGIIGKLTVFGLVLGHFIAGNVTWHLMAIASMDFVYALLFMSALKKHQGISALT